MNHIGMHVSSAGGIDKSPARAAELSCETFQCFSRPPQGGPAPKLTPDIVKNFKAEMASYGITAFYIHAPYIINLASLNPKTRHGSIGIILEELERGSLLGAPYIMTHIGSHKDQTIEEGLEKTKKSLNEILDKYTGETKLLVEISAGTGNIIGDTFEEIGEIVHFLRNTPGFGGVCFDTAHAFASGYDFHTKQLTEDVLKQFDTHIGLEWLKLTHVNDSKVANGAKRDLHEHIGYGHIKEEGMRNLLTSEPFQRIDWLLETPFDEKRSDDIEILKGMRSVI